MRAKLNRAFYLILGNLEFSLFQTHQKPNSWSALHWNYHDEIFMQVNQNQYDLWYCYLLKHCCDIKPKFKIYWWYLFCPTYTLKSLWDSFFGTPFTNLWQCWIVLKQSDVGLIKRSKYITDRILGFSFWSGNIFAFTKRSSYISLRTRLPCLGANHSRLSHMYF